MVPGSEQDLCSPLEVVDTSFIVPHLAGLAAHSVTDRQASKFK